MFSGEGIIYEKEPKKNHIAINFIKAGESKTKMNQRQNLTKTSNNINQNINNISYKLLIKRIALQLKKRVKLPKCKIFKFHLAYRLLILRIAKQLKNTAKKLNFWEKNEKEMTLQDVDQIQEIASTACKIIEKNGNMKKNKKKKNMGSSGRQDKKSPKFKITLLKKEEEEKLKNIKIIVENDKKNGNKLEILVNELKNIEINKNDINSFIKKFSSFLDKNNIEIIRENKLPNFITKEYEYLLTIKDFWIKYVTYIAEKYRNELNLFNFLNFIDQFFLWCQTPGKHMDFIVEIKILIYKTFDEEKINNFLLINKIQNFDQLFERYKIFKTYDREDKEKIIERKTDIKNCTCPTCKKKGVIQKKISEYNNKNNQMEFSKNNNLFLNSIYNINKFNKDQTVYDKNDKIEYEILSQNKYNDDNIFKFLNKIEKGKIESEKKKPRNRSNNKKKKESESKSSKNKKEKEKEIKNKNYNKKPIKNSKITAILDLMSIDIDDESY